MCATCWARGSIKNADAILGHPHAVEGRRGAWRGTWTHHRLPHGESERECGSYLPVDGVYAGWLVDLGAKTADDDAQDASEGVSQQFDSSSVDARLADHSPYRWPAAISIGTKPTFNEVTGMNDRVVEAYAVTDDWLDLYDHQVRVEFVGFLRPQIKFDSAQDLIDELKRNVEETKRITA